MLDEQGREATKTPTSTVIVKKWRDSEERCNNVGGGLAEIRKMEGQMNEPKKSLQQNFYS